MNIFPPPLNTGASRNQILDKVLAFFQGVAPIKIASRKLRMWTNVDESELPALFMLKTGEDVQQVEGMPPMITFDIELFIYTWANPQVEDPPPSAVMQDVLDAVYKALAPPPIVGRQTLGGLVSHCWVEGKTIEVPGDLEGKGVAIVPLRILIPS